jgi:hypothetical protein
MKTCTGCGRTYDVAFSVCECGSKLPDQTVEELVAAWFMDELTMLDAIHDSPEVAWLAILQILAMDLKEEQIGLLAAGPTESLLSMHGAQFIDRVEHEEGKNARFKYLLGGVWMCGMLEEIWKRVQAARKEA